MSKSKFEIFKDVNDEEFYFRLKAANGRNILASEGYTTKASCEKGIESVRKNASNDDRYSRKDAPGNYRFNLKAANGEIVGRSEGYSSEASREEGIEAVKTMAPDAGIADLT